MVLPCWDETDDGVPPPCKGDPAIWKIFNPLHPITNHSILCYKFGNVGWPSMDQHRKFYMGLAMWSTLLTMLVTAYGCLALSTDNDIVLKTYWSHASIHDKNDGSGWQAFMGLRSAVFIHDTPEGDHEQYTVLYDSSGSNFPESFPVIKEEVLDCQAMSTSYALGSFITCFTLIFGLQGVMARMRFSADANIQKTLGCFADSFGVLSLSYTLYCFWSSCYHDMPESNEAFTMLYWLGPGWYCFLFCAFTGAFRAGMHWITPTPGMGDDGHHGCHCGQWPLPQAVLDKLNEHGHEHDGAEALSHLHDHVHHPETKTKRVGLTGGKAGYGAVPSSAEMTRV